VPEIAEADIGVPCFSEFLLEVPHEIPGVMGVPMSVVNTYPLSFHLGPSANFDRLFKCSLPES